MASSGGVFADFDEVMARRHTEADEFYAELQKDIAGMPAPSSVQALAGMIWSKQFFHYDIRKGWRATRPSPSSGGRKHGRNSDWRHLNNADVISMPDKWEYPWYAAWDLGLPACHWRWSIPSSPSLSSSC